MNRILAKHKSAVKNICKIEKKIQNNMKSLKKQNKILFKLAKKTITHRDMNKISKINKSIYDFSSRINRIVYSNLDSRDSFIAYISE